MDQSLLVVKDTCDNEKRGGALVDGPPV